MDINAMFGMEYNPFRKTRNMKHIETSEFREVQARLRYLPGKPWLWPDQRGIRTRENDRSERMGEIIESGNV